MPLTIVDQSFLDACFDDGRAIDECLSLFPPHYTTRSALGALKSDWRLYGSCIRPEEVISKGGRRRIVTTGIKEDIRRS